MADSMKTLNNKGGKCLSKSGNLIIIWPYGGARALFADPPARDIVIRCCPSPPVLTPVRVAPLELKRVEDPH